MMLFAVLNAFYHCFFYVHFPSCLNVLYQTDGFFVSAWLPDCKLSLNLAVMQMVPHMNTAPDFISLASWNERALGHPVKQSFFTFEIIEI